MPLSGHKLFGIGWAYDASSTYRHYWTMGKGSRVLRPGERIVRVSIAIQEVAIALELAKHKACWAIDVY